MRFIGIDPSLVGTGVVCLNEEGNVEGQELIKTTPALEIEDRLKLISDHIQLLIDKYQIRHADGYKHAGIVYMEGLSFGSKNGNAVTQLAGLHYFLRINLRNRFNLEYKIIPPTTLKKFVTGKGNSKKEVMLLEIYKKWNISYRDNNLADSFGLAKMSYEDFINGRMEKK